ncbi:hypothetical protein BYT27DRAFT_6791605 [Phlegmacium glaucopus]|nr:hypothetical protein BYT27DRAFT_6791605 [Phlegmacium glaucopus]
MTAAWLSIADTLCSQLSPAICSLNYMIGGWSGKGETVVQSLLPVLLQGALTVLSIESSMESHHLGYRSRLLYVFV